MYIVNVSNSKFMKNEMAMILTSDSKNVVIGQQIILIKNQVQVDKITSKRKKFIIPEMISGKYTFIVKVFFLRPNGLDSSLIFKYKLGMHKGEKSLRFRLPHQKVNYLDTVLEYVSPEYLQLSLSNSFDKEDVVIRKTGEVHKRTLLRPQEMQKVIIEKKSLDNYVISYEVKGKQFIETELTKTINKLKTNTEYDQILQNVINDPKNIENVLAYPGTLLDDNFIKILKFEIENPERIKAHDQKCFVFNYKLSHKIRFERSKFYIDLKYSTNKLCILGDVRFAINNFSEEELVMDGK